ncbi:hypothetical protein ACW7G0_03685 [Lysobacter sp. A286]
MKQMVSVLVFLLMAGVAPAAHSLVLPAELGQQLEQRIDAFVAAPGYEELDVESMVDQDWYARFPNAGESALLPDADLDPVTRSMLLFDSREAPLGADGIPARARYRITRHQRSLGDDWSDVRHSYIEITRYNLAPSWHRMLVAEYGDRAAPAGPARELPHVSWRLVTTGVMGQRAAVVAASRRVITPDEASQAMCLGRPCLALEPMEPTDAGDFEPMPAPELAPAIYRGATVSQSEPEFAIAAPARIAQALFQLATGEYDELHEGATPERPEITMLIGLNSSGQERNSSALMHLTALMDDATSASWIQRLEAPGNVEWQRVDVARSRGH